jgi:hypothetical protein
MKKKELQEQIHLLKNFYIFDLKKDFQIILERLNNSGVKIYELQCKIESRDIEIKELKHSYEMLAEVVRELTPKNHVNS